MEWFVTESKKPSKGRKVIGYFPKPAYGSSYAIVIRNDASWETIEGSGVREPKKWASIERPTAINTVGV